MRRSLGVTAAGIQTHFMVGCVRDLETVEGLVRNAYPLRAMGIAMGLHAWIGQEDNLWWRKGERATSVQQIEKLVRISKELYRPIATAQQARVIYPIGEFYSSADETLEKIGWLAAAMFLVAGTAGPAGAMVANLTPLAIHGTAFATLTLANNLIGLAPGPILTGWIADKSSLHTAFQLLPISGLAAAGVFALARQSYLADLARLASSAQASAQ